MVYLSGHSWEVSVEYKDKWGDASELPCKDWLIHAGKDLRSLRRRVDRLRSRLLVGGELSGNTN